MKMFRVVTVTCGFFILVGGAFGQSVSGTPTRVTTKHHKSRKIPAPPSPVVTPAATPDISQETLSVKKFEISLYGGVTGFRGLNDMANWPAGFLAGFWAGFSMDPHAMVGLRSEYAYLPASPSGFGEPSGTTTGYNGAPDMNIICFVPSLKLNLNPMADSPIQPYILIGTGIMNKSMANGGFQVGNTSMTFTGYSQTVPMVSFAVGLPIQLPDDYQIPLMAEIETGFTNGQNTNLEALTLGINRAW